MKRLFLILSVLMSCGACASSNHRPSLFQINKSAKTTVADLHAKEESKTLTDEEEKILTELKNLKDKTEIKELLKYSERDIDSSDVLTLAWGTGWGYSDEELDQFLKLGLYTKNPYCENEFRSYEVFQVLPDFVLASGCEVKDYDECSTTHGKIFMFPKQKDELYFDKKILIPPHGYCSVYAGVYQYESKNDIKHTVPVLLFLPRTIYKGQLENIEKTREESQKSL